MYITGYDAICNLGNNIDEIYTKAINGDTTCFINSDKHIKNKNVRLGIINIELTKINEEDYNIRCNQLLEKNLDLLKDKISKLLKKYDSSKIGIVAASTNSGVEEYESSNNQKHFELGNPAKFLRKHLNLNGFYATVSTACSSGIKAFSLARDLIDKRISDAVIVACVDTITKVPIYGFDSLEVLSATPCIPFSKNRTGMNIGEASAVFIIENLSDDGIKIMGIGESSDVFHSTTPDPTAKESINAILTALNDAQITANDIDYINVHGTGTVANDIMEAKAISKVFSDSIPVSSTKPCTGHCLGAAAGIETALCCKLLDMFDGRLYPHIYDNKYDDTLDKIMLAAKDKQYPKCKICMCNSFGFGGTNAILILGKNNE